MNKMKQDDKINVLLIGKNTKMLKFLEDTLSTMNIGHSILVLPELSSLCDYLDLAPEWRPQILFLDASQKLYINSIQAIRSFPKYDALSIIIFDPAKNASDVEESFAAGANIYIRQQKDLRQLGNILKKAIAINWQYFRGNMNRETFFVSV